MVMRSIFTCIGYGKEEKTISMDEYKYSYRFKDGLLSICKYYDKDLLPFQYEDEDMILLLNGDIYDFKSRDIKELAKTIKNRGFGESLKILRGVFSLIYLDKVKNRLYISRDHIGIYPLYYYLGEDLLLISNDLGDFKTIKSFKKEINKKALAQFFQRGYISQPLSIFENVYKVLNAHFIEIDLFTKSLKEHKYWDINDIVKKDKIVGDSSEIVKNIEKLLLDAIENSSGGDKDIASFLSGGYDSSTIVALSKNLKNKKIHTFTMGFEDENFSESINAKNIAKYLKTDHHEHILDKDILFKYIYENLSIHPEPFGDKASLASNILIQDASNYSNIILGGDGGDEMMFSSSFLKKALLLNKIPFFIRKPISALLNLKKDVSCIKWVKILGNKEIYNSVNYKIMLMSRFELSDLIKGYQPISPIEFRKVEVDNFYDGYFLNIINDYLFNDLVVKTSILAMHYKIKISLPFLDKEFIEYILRVDPKIKFENGEEKFLTKQIAYKYIPNELLDQPKKGFFVPLEEYIKKDHESIFERYLSKDKIKKEGVLNYDEVEKIKNNFLKSDKWIDQQRLWNLLVFEIWYEDWFGKDI